MIFFINDRNKICSSKFEDEQNRGQKVVELGYLRNMIVTEKIIMTNIIGNFVANNIVFEIEALAHHPKDLSLEICKFSNFHQVS